MSDWKFKPGDFRVHNASTTDYHMAARANVKLQEWLKEGEVVYGNFGINNHNEITHEDLNPAHKALLIRIEPVEQCKHEHSQVVFYDKFCQGSFGMQWWQCSKCGAKVKPSGFEVVK